MASNRLNEEVRLADLTDLDLSPNLFEGKSLKSRVAQHTLGIFFVSICAFSIYAAHLLRENMRWQIGAQQYSRVSVIAREIDDGIRDRLGALEIIAAELSPIVNGDPRALQSLLSQRPLLLHLFNGGVRATQVVGQEIASVGFGAQAAGDNPSSKELIDAILRGGVALVGQPHRAGPSAAPLLAMGVPIFDRQGNLSGTLMGITRLDAPNFLDRIKSSQGTAAEDYALIDRRSGVYVSATDKRLILSAFPEDSKDAVDVANMGGLEGVGVTKNRQGALEMSASKGIPVADWLIISTIAAEQVFAPIDELLYRMLFVALVLTAVAGFLTWWAISSMLRRQFAPLLATTRALDKLTGAVSVAPTRGARGLDEIGELMSVFTRLLGALRVRESQKQESESFKNTILNSLEAEIAVVDSAGVIRAVNNRWSAFAVANGKEPGEPAPHTGLGTNYFSVCGVSALDETTRDRVAANSGLKAVLEGRLPRFQMEYPCDSPDVKRWFSMVAMPLGQDVREGAVITHTDISARKRDQARLELAASVFTHVREGIMITDATGCIVEVNEAFTRITGYGREEVLGQSPRVLNSGLHDREFFSNMWGRLVEHGYWTGEIWNRRKNGEVFEELQTVSAVVDDAGIIRHYVSVFSDITLLKAHQLELDRMAHFDALTGLPNRFLLADRLQLAMAQAHRRSRKLAVVYIDLDGFKGCNDEHGHAIGDQLLIALGTAMKGTLRDSDTLARIGGDEFVAVLDDLDDMNSSAPMLSRLLAAAAQPVTFGDLTLQVSASLGVTYYPQAQEIDADQLLRQADQAMYHAKLAGKNRVDVFDSALDSSVREHNESVESIRVALSRKEFVLHYQPKVNMRTGTVIGAEALIRWQHPVHGLLPPAKFLPVIEDHALAVAVGEWVIDAALTQISLWRASGHDIPVSVNIGARQLQQDDFVERLGGILARHPEVSPGYLELEVLETSALEDISKASKVFRACADMGVSLALDDFGTGYSSLTYLKRLHVGLIKIDQSFVRDMLEDRDDLAILRAVISLAAAFGRQVIAEGVETIAHGTLLLQLGCELAQGYGIARPMPAESLPHWASQWRPDSAWAAESAVNV